MKTVTAHTYQNEYEITKTFFLLEERFHASFVDFSGIGIP